MHALPSDIHLLDVDRPPEPGRLIWPRKGPLDVAQGMSEARLRSSLKPCVSNGPPGELAAVRPPGAILETRPTAWPPDPPPARPPRTPPPPLFSPVCLRPQLLYRVPILAFGSRGPAGPPSAGMACPCGASDTYSMPCSAHMRAHALRGAIAARALQTSAARLGRGQAWDSGAGARARAGSSARAGSGARDPVTRARGRQLRAPARAST